MKDTGQAVVCWRDAAGELGNPVGGPSLERRGWKEASWTFFLVFEPHFKQSRLLAQLQMAAWPGGLILCFCMRECIKQTNKEKRK